MTLLTTHPIIVIAADKAAEIQRLADYRADRAHVCGCDRCGDIDEARALDGLIKHSLEQIGRHQADIDAQLDRWRA